MKTADLIPLILFQLSNGDKYGFELTKEIEDKSNQKIQIKQPTLYTVLKKLEKSKFISSYWQDSEIGGKRHYYKITENGRAQLSTLPSFDECLKIALMSENEEMENVPSAQPELDNTVLPENEAQTVSVVTPIESAMEPQKEEPAELTTNVNFVVTRPEKEKSEDKFVSIMDLIADSAPTSSAPTPKESIVDASDLFNQNHIDNQTEIEINKQNTSLLKDNNTLADEQFASNKEISKFVDKKPIPQPEIKIQEPKKAVESIKPATNADYAYSDIKYVDYQDFKNKKEYIRAKKLAKLSLFRGLIFSIYSILMMILCLTVASKFPASTLFYVIFSITVLATLCYVITIIKSNESFRLKVQNNTYNPKFKFRLIFATICTLVVLIVSIIMGIICTNGTAYGVFSAENFGNIYAPFLLTSSIWVDLALTYLFYKTSK